jgi:hypothetical protein
MRACQPIRDGYIEREGIKVHYEVYGAGEPTILLLPTWSIMHSRHWKMQIPYLLAPFHEGEPPLCWASPAFRLNAKVPADPRMGVGGVTSDF